MAAPLVVTSVTNQEESDPHAGERRLTDEAEYLWRQVPSGFLDKGVPSSQTFRPMPKDQGKPSIARGAVVDAEGACRRHRSRGYDSVGTLAVTVGEVTAEKLSAWDDSELPGVPEEHGYIDFRDLATKGEQQRRATKLLDRALARGWVYRYLGND